MTRLDALERFAAHVRRVRPSAAVTRRLLAELDATPPSTDFDYLLARWARLTETSPHRALILHERMDGSWDAAGRVAPSEWPTEATASGHVGQADALRALLPKLEALLRREEVP